MELEDEDLVQDFRARRSTRSFSENSMMLALNAGNISSKVNKVSVVVKSESLDLEEHCYRSRRSVVIRSVTLDETSLSSFFVTTSLEIQRDQALDNQPKSSGFGLSKSLSNDDSVLGTTATEDVTRSKSVSFTAAAEQTDVRERCEILDDNMFEEEDKGYVNMFGKCYSELDLVTSFEAAESDCINAEALAMADEDLDRDRNEYSAIEEDDILNPTAIMMDDDAPFPIFDYTSNAAGSNWYNRAHITISSDDVLPAEEHVSLSTSAKTMTAGTVAVAMPLPCHPLSSVVASASAPLPPAPLPPHPPQQTRPQPPTSPSVSTVLSGGKKCAFLMPLDHVPVAHSVPNNLSMEEDLAKAALIGVGSNSEIFLVENNGVRVAVKMIKESCKNNHVAMTEFEIEFETLVRLDHPNVLKIYGGGYKPRRFLVLEYISGVNLNSLLMRNIAKKGIVGRLRRDPTFDYRELLLRALDIADVCWYLHERFHPEVMIIHRDLKPDNIGFTRDGTLKVFDFGLCTHVKPRSLETQAYEMSGNTGSRRYMAPEVCLKKPYSERCDVYSFGILLWQMARDRIPYENLTREEFVCVVATGRMRPKLHKYWKKEFCELLTDCWDQSPVNRPSFKSIVSRLEAMLDST